MESTVIFRDGMDNDPADHNKVQAFVQRSLDHLVADAVTPDRKYAGFLASTSAAAEITVQPGRLYVGGKVYDRASAFVRNFATTLPIASKKIVLVVAYGQEAETDERPREFLVNEDTGAAEPRVVANELARICNVNVVPGQESPDPLEPVLDAGVVAIARVLLTPAGVSSVDMIAANALESVAGVGQRVAGLEDFQRRTGPAIAALGSDLAGLKVATANTVDKVAYGRSLVRLAVLETAANIPTTAVDSAADFFLTADRSDLAFVGTDVKIAEGIRFPDAGAATGALAIFNPLDAAAKVVGDVLYPAYTRELRMAVGPRQAEVAISSFSYAANELVQLTMSRTRIRYGEEMTVCTNAGLWGSQQGQYVPGTFVKDGENFETISVDWDGPSHGWVRARRFWYDTYEEPYWSYVTVARNVPGAQVAETFLQANDMVLDAVGLTFTRLANAGGLSLAICEVTDGGLPDLKAVISYTTVARESLTLAGETVIPVQPVYLQGGKRYAILVISAADHWLATTGGANYPQGTFFYVLDGAYQQGDGTRDLCFSLYAAKFAQARAVINLNALQLAGGMTAIDILADTVLPRATTLTYEVQIGGAWVPLGRTDASALATAPPLVPLRAVFTGTPDVMPALKLAGSVVKLSRPKLALTQVSATRNLPGAGSTQIRVIARLEYFETAHHTATCRLRTGAGYATLVNANSFVDEVAEDGAIERTWIFNLGAAVTSYKIQFGATTDAAGRPFHFGWRKDFAL